MRTPRGNIDLVTHAQRPPPPLAAHSDGGRMGDKDSCEELADVDTEAYRFLVMLNTKLQRGLASPGTYVDVTVEEIEGVCRLVLEKIKADPMLLELKTPIEVVGDIHGQYFDLLRIFRQAGFPGTTQYLFLGDYVDRGPQSVESLALLFTYKAMFPNNLYLLRGNHECLRVCERLGLKQEMEARYGMKNLYLNFVQIFNYMPIAAVIEEQIFCVHGGLSKQLLEGEVTDLRATLNGIARPIDVHQFGLVADLLWSDPIPFGSRRPTGWAPSPRGGASHAFGHDVIDAFLDKYHLTNILRAHEVEHSGFRHHNGQKLTTIFSAPNYVNVCKNDGAVLSLKRGDNGMLTGFMRIFQPSYIHYRVPFSSTLIKKENIAQSTRTQAGCYDP